MASPTTFSGRPWKREAELPGRIAPILKATGLLRQTGATQLQLAYNISVILPGSIESIIEMEETRETQVSLS